MVPVRKTDFQLSISNIISVELSSLFDALSSHQCTLVERKKKLLVMRSIMRKKELSNGVRD